MSSGETTTDDIVNMTGVIRSTVSRYPDGDSVKEPTGERIQETIREYNYEPNIFTGLRAKESNVIRVVLPTPDSKVSSRVVTNVGRCLGEQGYETPIKDSGHGVGLRLKNIRRLATPKVDGIILSTITITGAHRGLIQENPVPVVMAAQEYDGGVFVVHDDYGAGKAMGVHVGRVAPARVGHMGVSGLDVTMGLNRKQDVVDGLREYSVRNVVVVVGDHGCVSGIHMVKEILDQGPMDTIIRATDRLAFGVYHVLGKRGPRISEDVFMAGFGRYDESTLLKPELTTLRFDSYGLDYLGVETVLKIIHREPMPKRQIVDYRIVEGESIKK